MSRFLEKLDVELLENGETWRVLDPMEYEVGCVGSGEKIVVPVGTLTDFGSVPQFLWGLISPIGPATRGYVLHDYLYTVQTYSRLKSDNILLEALGVLGLSWHKRWAIWLGVRSGGWIAWAQHKAENNRKPSELKGEENVSKT